MAAVICVAFWKGFPFSTVIYLAALQTLDEEQIEAAKIDGAGSSSPPLRCDASRRSLPVAAVNVLLTTILTFNYFDIIYVLTRGGPLNATAIFPTRIYDSGFGQFRFGEAATYGAVSPCVLVLFVAVFFLSSAGRGGDVTNAKSPVSKREDDWGSVVLQALAYLVLCPFFWMFSVSLKPADRAFRDPCRLWPRPRDPRELCSCPAARSSHATS